jgi:hypothetical protein
VLEAAINENPDVPGFIRTYQPPFPIGTASGLSALEYIQWPLQQRSIVPLMVFIDRAGMIRAQYTGVDTSFFDDDMEKHFREEAEKLLKEGPPRPAKSSSGSKSKK